MNPSGDITRAAQQTNKNNPDETVIDLGVVCNRLKEVEYLEEAPVSYSERLFNLNPLVAITKLAKSMIGTPDTSGSLKSNTIKSK